MLGPLLKTSALPASLLLTVAFGLATATSGQTTSTQTKGALPKTKPATPAKKLDLNHATAEELTEFLPGVGAVTARKIVEGRPYTTVNDLAKVGIPDRTIEAIRPLVTVAPTAPLRPRTKSATKDEPEVNAAHPLNLNTATPAQLEELPGIGPAHAAAIVAGRPYATVDDLEKVKGLGAARVNALRSLVTTTEPAPVAPVEIPKAAPGATRRAMTKKSATAPAAKKSQLAPGQVVNINTAPKEVLDLLPGIGPVKAQAIIEGRPFKTKEDIMKVKGIKEGEFSKIRDMITVN